MSSENYLKISQLIEDVKRAYKANAQFSAVALVLSLVAACSRLEYPAQVTDKERFIRWVNKYAIKDFWESPNHTNYHTPYLNAELLYQIRCCLFHEGSNYVDFSNPKVISIQDNRNLNASTFVYIIHTPNSYGFSHPQGGSMGQSDFLHIPLESIIQPLILAVQSYIDLQPSKDVSLKMHVIDYTKTYEDTNNI